MLKKYKRNCYINIYNVAGFFAKNTEEIFYDKINSVPLVTETLH